MSTNFSFAKAKAQLGVFANSISETILDDFICFVDGSMPDSKNLNVPVQYTLDFDTAKEWLEEIHEDWLEPTRPRYCLFIMERKHDYTPNKNMIVPHAVLSMILINDDENNATYIRFEDLEGKAYLIPYNQEELLKDCNCMVELGLIMLDYPYEPTLIRCDAYERWLPSHIYRYDEYAQIHKRVIDGKIASEKYNFKDAVRECIYSCGRTNNPSYCVIYALNRDKAGEYRLNKITVKYWLTPFIVLDITGRIRVFAHFEPSPDMDLGMLCEIATELDIDYLKST